jgi:hypothetical protein
MFGNMVDASMAVVEEVAKAEGGAVDMEATTSSMAATLSQTKTGKKKAPPAYLKGTALSKQRSQNNTRKTAGNASSRDKSPNSLTK